MKGSPFHGSLPLNGPVTSHNDWNERIVCAGLTINHRLWRYIRTSLTFSLSSFTEGRGKACAFQCRVMMFLLHLKWNVICRYGGVSFSVESKTKEYQLPSTVPPLMIIDRQAPSCHMSHTGLAACRSISPPSMLRCRYRIQSYYIMWETRTLFRCNTKKKTQVRSF